MPRNKLGLISIQIFTIFQNVTQLILFIIAKPLTVVCELTILVVFQSIGLHRSYKVWKSDYLWSITAIFREVQCNIKMLQCHWFKPMCTSVPMEKQNYAPHFKVLICRMNSFWAQWHGSILIICYSSLKMVVLLHRLVALDKYTLTIYRSLAKHSRPIFSNCSQFGRLSLKVDYL